MDRNRYILLINRSSNQGFDVVIGNPPYGAKLSDNDKEKYRAYFPETQFKIDTYSLFVLQSLKVLSHNAICYYIIPNTFLDNYFEEAVRKKMLEGSVIEINDLTDKVFNAAVVHSMILGFSNKRNPDNVVKINDSPILSSDFKYIPQYFFLEQPQCSFSIRQYETSGLVNKLKTNSKRLVEVLDIRQAIKSGNDSKYIKTEKLAENYKPILRGKDIKRFTIVDPNLYLDYGKHLACPRHPNIFEQPKILIREAGATIVATLDDSNHYIMSSLYNAILIDNNYSLKYLLGLVDSTLFQYLMNKLTFEKTKGAFTKAKIFHYYELPVKIATATQQQPIINLVDRILAAKRANPQADTSELETKINNLVYELYGLTDEEIKVVEGK
ncbi:MAG: Eco57I restriction-modification methylase domain-containing protein [Bacteroidales bacterium]|nr:Eco57I restriction-modification methylase domain-containing protein [Bacteroidales bacterium]